MLLRESGRELGQSVNIEAVVNRGVDLATPTDLTDQLGAEGGERCGRDPYGFPAATELLRFASAANRMVNLLAPEPGAGSPSDHANDDRAGLTTARAALVAAVGMEGMMEAAATVAIFNGLVRVADGTGIQLDSAMVDASGSLRHGLGLNTMAGAANTPDASTSKHIEPGRSTVADLFFD